MSALDHKAFLEVLNMYCHGKSTSEALGRILPELVDIIDATLAYEQGLPKTSGLDEITHNVMPGSEYDLLNQIATTLANLERKVYISDTIKLNIIGGEQDYVQSRR